MCFYATKIKRGVPASTKETGTENLIQEARLKKRNCLPHVHVASREEAP
jgi:hypothetical protein